MNFACSLATEVKKTIFLDCWSGNDKLKKFYVNNGFESQGDFPEESYLPFLNTTNLIHAKRCEKCWSLSLD